MISYKLRPGNDLISNRTTAVSGNMAIIEQNGIKYPLLPASFANAVGICLRTGDKDMNKYIYTTCLIVNCLFIIASAYLKYSCNLLKILGIYGLVICSKPNTRPMVERNIKTKRFLFLLSSSSLCLI
jgi:hypothetical protein